MHAPVIAQFVTLILASLGVELAQDEHDSLVSAVTMFVTAVGTIVIVVGNYFQRRKDKQ